MASFTTVILQMSRPLNPTACSSLRAHINVMLYRKINVRLIFAFRFCRCICLVSEGSLVRVTSPISICSLHGIFSWSSIDSWRESFPVCPIESNALLGNPQLPGLLVDSFWEVRIVVLTSWLILVVPLCIFAFVFGCNPVSSSLVGTQILTFPHQHQFFPICIHYVVIMDNQPLTSVNLLRPADCFWYGLYHLIFSFLTRPRPVLEL